MIWTSKLVLKEMLLPFIKTRSSLNSDDCRIRLELSLLFFSIVNQKHDIIKQLQKTSLQGDSALKSTNKWVSIRIFKETK
jgi:hypothetical protein